VRDLLADNREEIIMGFLIEEAIWENSKQEGIALLVLLAIATHADNDTGMCYPSQERLAKVSRCSVRGVQKIVSRLVEDGEVDIIIKGGEPGAKRTSTHYSLAKYLLLVRKPTPEPGSSLPPNGVRPYPRTPFALTPEPGSSLPPNGVRPNLSSESVNESVNESASRNIEKLGAEEEALRVKISKAVGRDPQIQWTDNEVRLISGLAAMSIPPKSIDTLVEYYRANIPGNDYRRQTVRALLDNFTDELDKSQAWKRKMRNFNL